MHFSSFGRAYGERQVAFMLVPAWDFGADAWLEARTTMLRGVENGYAIVRASREGLLTVSDAYGRVIAETNSASLPGASLIAKLRIGTQVATLYTQIGDVFGWFCVALAGLMLVIAFRKKITGQS